MTYYFKIAFAGKQRRRLNTALHLLMFLSYIADQPADCRTGLSVSWLEPH